MAYANRLVLADESSSDSDQAATDSAQAEYFELHIRPLLAEHCWSCHGDEKQEGSLRLDSPTAFAQGGDSGELTSQDDPSDSLLLQAIRYEGLEMPPDNQLGAEEIAKLERWVAAGSVWPKEDPETLAKRNQVARERFSDHERSWWAIQPISHPTPPELDTQDQQWCRNEIDRFIARTRTAQQLTPAPEADRETLVRRLYFDVIGLPPTPEQINAFVNDVRPDAYDHLVDELLDSDAYGERWARHWLDVVRFAESDGYRIDHFRPEAWRFRDYVIRSLNQDKPYDRFLQEQIAGDELFPGDLDALIATGFLRHTIYEYNSRDVPGQRDTILNEVTDTVGEAFLGMGFQCARCHNHKYDPILQKDYYQLRAFFEGITWRDDLVLATPEQQNEYQQQLEKWNAATAAIRDEISRLEQQAREKLKNEAIGRFPLDIQAIIHKPEDVRTPYEQQIVDLAWRQVDYEYLRIDDVIKGEAKERRLQLKRDLAAQDAIKPKALASVAAVTDVAATAPATTVPKKQLEVHPAVPTILKESQSLPDCSPLAQSSGRRTALAKWLSSPSNPLPARVMVNRVWQSHFGRSLTANASDFGFLGGPPSHPELLDWLATRFQQEGWKLKPLHRLMLTSATYRQSSIHPNLQANRLIDPENRLYWRYQSRRLDAEQIRDAILAVTGKLDRRAGGPSTQGDVPRRSIYTRVMRNARDPLLDVFDLPQFFSSTSSRDSTTTPIQSLMLINNTALLNYAKALAQQASRGTDRSDRDVTHAFDSQVDYLWQWIFAKHPTATQRRQAVEFLVSQMQLIDDETRGKSQIANADGSAPEMSNATTSKMPFRDGQSVLINSNQPDNRFVTSRTKMLQVDDFTVEAYFQVRSIYDSGAVRTIASTIDPKNKSVGWTLGITGKGSRRKPQTLVMQMYGTNADKPDQVIEAAVFSDHFVELNKPYYVAASVRMARDGKPGTITFHLKDLSNDDLPLDSRTVEHSLAALPTAEPALTIAARMASKDSMFDGLIDDVRISRGVLDVGQLLLTNESAATSLIGHWQFEIEPGLLRDSGNNHLNLSTSDERSIELPASDQALIDYCHILLNSNSFLYIY